MIEPVRPITPAQARVAELVAQGLSYGTIAKRLELSRHTVRAHIRAIAMRLPGCDGVSYYNTVLLWASRTYTN